MVASSSADCKRLRPPPAVACSLGGQPAREGVSQLVQQRGYLGLALLQAASIRHRRQRSHQLLIPLCRQWLSGAGSKNWQPGYSIARQQGRPQQPAASAARCSSSKAPHGHAGMLSSRRWRRERGPHWRDRRTGVVVGLVNVGLCDDGPRLHHGLLHLVQRLLLHSGANRRLLSRSDVCCVVDLAAATAFTSARTASQQGLDPRTLQFHPHRMHLCDGEAQHGLRLRRGGGGAQHEGGRGASGKQALAHLLGRMMQPFDDVLDCMGFCGAGKRLLASCASSHTSRSGEPRAGARPLQTTD